MSWLDRRVCIGVPPKVFFPDQGGDWRTPKAICAGCPVKAECLAHALEHREDDGIWGGLSAKERRRLPKPSKGRYAAECGTPSGYRAHRRRGEEACLSCRHANAAQNAGYRSAHRDEINAAKRAARAEVAA